MNAPFINAATSAAIELAKLAVSLDTPEHKVVDDAWKAVRESIVKQMPATEQKGLRLDLEELYNNTKLHAATRTRVTKAAR